MQIAKLNPNIGDVAHASANMFMKTKENSLSERLFVTGALESSICFKKNKNTVYKTLQLPAKNIKVRDVILALVLKK